MKPISKDESITKFLFSERLFDGPSKQNRRAKYGAFLPPDAEAKTSITRISELSESEIWNRGQEAGVNRPAKLKGRADFFVFEALNVGLTIEPDEPPPQHAHLIYPSLIESEQILIAKQLSNVAALIVI